MNIYISHSRKFDFQKDLYQPILDSDLANKHHFILPHEKSEAPYETKELFRAKRCNFIIAEVSYPSTGQGVELGWADILEIPVVCIYKQGAEISIALSSVSNKFLMYTDSENMIQDIRT